MVDLYIKATCPFCHKVLRFADRHNIKLSTKDIYLDSNARAELLRHGGKNQVPYLVDEEHNVAMYESDDIIDYLETKHVS